MHALDSTRIFLLSLVIVAAPVPVFAQESTCGNPYADGGGNPHDYRTASPAQLAVVERRHYTANVRALRRGESTSDIAADVAYTLRKFPNHYHALLTMGDWSIRSGKNPPRSGQYTVECWFDRAMRFAPDDPMVQVVFGMYLIKRGKPREAVKQLEAAREADASNPNVHYNLGLAYLEAKEFDKAVESAHQAYALGFPLPGLKDRLARAGKWRDAAAASTPEADAAAPAR